MTESLLNQNQRRHVATLLEVLAEDLRALADFPEEKREEPSYRRLREALDAVEATMLDISAALDLPPLSTRSLRRRIGAVGSVWAARTYDLTARRLRGYGTVRAEVKSRLDPLVAELRARLFALTDAAKQLPED